jgi:hypothetical protein
MTSSSEGCTLRDIPDPLLPCRGCYGTCPYKYPVAQLDVPTSISLNDLYEAERALYRVRNPLRNVKMEQSLD